MRALTLLCALTLVAACGPPPQGGAGRAGERLVRGERALMGTYFRVQVHGGPAGPAEAAIEAALDEVERVEALLSEWREDSEISRVNDGAGRLAVRVGPELLEVVRRSLELRRRTDGAFDITFAACGRLWSFRDRRIPQQAEIERCLELVGGQVRLDEASSTIFLPRRGQRIGISAIGKGYGVDRAAEVLLARGIRDFLVDGGGDLRVSGRKGESAWSVGVAHPRRPGLYGSLEAGDGAVVTSGDYQSFFEREGTRYHHILDPRTGQPARRSAAVTVIAANATDADALATGLFVMGPRAGLELVERLPGVEALFFDPDLQVHRSSGFPELR